MTHRPEPRDGFTLSDEELYYAQEELSEYGEDGDYADYDEWLDEHESDPFLTDAEADADALASAGWGTDEDYGCYDDCYYDEW